MRVKIISSGRWQMERWGAVAQLEPDTEGLILKRLQSAKSTPKDYLSESNNCRAKSRVSDELIKHMSCLYFDLSCFSDLLDLVIFSDAAQTTNPRSTQFKSLLGALSPLPCLCECC